MVAELSSFFGFLALLLACVGLYGLMSYAVTQRTNEIGIRMALGAQVQDVLWMVMREVLMMIGVGIAVGMPAAIAAARLIASLLYGLAPFDPVTLVIAPFVLLVTATLAGYFPARRAMKVDPMVALRCE
jgi:ABC-type antimicrobial peptide transport system permease subunit